MRASILLLGLAACRPTSTDSTPVTATATATAAVTATATATAAGPAIRSFFVTPSDSGLQPVVDAIAAARKSIRMTMFHLTQPDVENALVAAKARGVDVRVILDGRLLEKASASEIGQRLVDRGISVTKSSPAFSITHVKAMVVDDALAMILSLNLTRAFDHTRDYGIVTDDRGVIDEMIRVFDADVANAAAGTGKTPPLAEDALVWAPVDAEARLVKLVDSAQKTVLASTENLGDKAMQEAFARAAGRGVAVRLLVPECDENSNPLRNVKFVTELDKKNVDARVMPPPASREEPYEHGKMIVVDGARAFIGSINFSANSMTRARELGIVFEDPAAIHAFSNAFDSDWRFAAPPPDDKSVARELCR